VLAAHKMNMKFNFIFIGRNRTTRVHGTEDTALTRQ